MKTSRRCVDVNLDELDRVLDGARQAPLSQDDYEKLKEALHALAAMLVRPRTTEKTSAVLGKPEGAGAGAGGGVGMSLTMLGVVVPNCTPFPAAGGGSGLRGSMAWSCATTWTWSSRANRTACTPRRKRS